MRGIERELSERLQVNYLFVFEAELLGNGKAHIPAARAPGILERHELKSGITVATALENQGSGKATIGNCSSEGIDLEIIIERPALPRETVTLAVAIPRPQTVKKLLQLSASVGIRSLYLVKSYNCVKSYLQSKSLLKEAVQAELLSGLEQSGDCVFPDVRIFRTFNSFIKAVENGHGLRIFADTEQPNRVNSRLNWSSCPLAQPVLLAIGPESGWTDHECERMTALNFKTVSLGPRIQRVEVAATLLLGQILALQHQNN